MRFECSSHRLERSGKALQLQVGSKLRKPFSFGGRMLERLEYSTNTAGATIPVAATRYSHAVMVLFAAHTK